MRIARQDLGHCTRKRYSDRQQGYVSLFSLRSASFASIPSPMQYTLKASFRLCLARGQSLCALKQRQ
jgi:hypothetical protein